jgi:hypothetical protein
MTTGGYEQKLSGPNNSYLSVGRFEDAITVLGDKEDFVKARVEKMNGHEKPEL